MSMRSQQHSLPPWKRRGNALTSKVRPGLANAPLGVGRDLRSRTAALSNPLCYPIGASEVRAYGEPPFYLQANKQEVSSSKSPCVPLLLPDAKSPALRGQAAPSQVRAERAGWGWGAEGLGPPKAIIEAGAYAVCVRAADPGHAPAPHSSK